MKKPKTEDILGEGVAKRRARRKNLQWTAPPFHVQKALRDVFLPYLSVINIHGIATRTDDVSAVKNFFHRSVPIRSEKTWEMVKKVVGEDVQMMRGFASAFELVMNQITQYKNENND
jgi:hypothetical protein